MPVRRIAKLKTMAMAPGVIAPCNQRLIPKVVVENISKWRDAVRLQRLKMKHGGGPGALARAAGVAGREQKQKKE